MRYGIKGCLIDPFNQIDHDFKGKDETTYIGVKSSQILEFKKIENIYKVSVNFISEIITCIKDKENKIISGNPQKIKKVNDTWKFARNIKSQNPNWQLIETEV